MNAEVAQAQKEGSRAYLLHMDSLPASMDRPCRAYLASRGVVFSNRILGDPYFRTVEFPRGWTKVLTSHPMWSKVLDENRKEVVAIFYKAIHYDRKALTRLPHPSLPN